jgi:hypothetical protein
MMAWRVLLATALLSPLITAAQAAEVTGSWRVTISTADNTIGGKASLKQVGNKITAWVGPRDDDPIPVHGEVTGSKLTIKTSPQPGRTVAFDRCDLSVDGDRMVGTIDGDKGKIEFVRSTR